MCVCVCVCVYVCTYERVCASVPTVSEDCFNQHCESGMGRLADLVDGRLAGDANADEISGLQDLRREGRRVTMEMVREGRSEAMEMVREGMSEAMEMVREGRRVSRECRRRRAGEGMRGRSE